MKLLRFIPTLLLVFPGLNANAQCDNPVDSDNFSNASAWTSNGAGLVSVSGGTCSFNAAQCSVYDRLYRPLAATLSDTYFKAEFKFTIQPNSSGQGYGANLLGFSAGTLDPISYDNSQSYAFTPQDGLVIAVSTVSTTDNNINNCRLLTISKDGTAYTSGANYVSLNSSISTYYVVFERTSATQTLMSVYTDAAHTQLHGQATNIISATITGLTHLHSGIATGGWTSRYFTGTVDDVVICDDLGIPSCTLMDSDTYSNASAWTSNGAGLVSVSGGACTFNSAQCSVYDRVYRPLTSTLSDSYFKAEFKFTVQPNSSGEGYGANLLGFSAGTLDPLNYDNSQSYASTPQDGLVLVLSTASTSDNNLNNCRLYTTSKDGTTYTAGTNFINLSSSISTYYVVFERVSATQTAMNVYTDVAHTQLHGQASNTIPATVTGLTHLHSGATTGGWNTRHFTGTVDDVVICDDLTGISPAEAANGYNVYPNPSATGNVTVNFGDHHPETIYVYDALGQLVRQSKIAPGNTTAEMTLPSGFYLLVLEEEGVRYTFRQIVE